MKKYSYAVFFVFLLILACAPQGDDLGNEEKNNGIEQTKENNSETLKPESCNDGIQNQKETDIDCGGGCRQCGVGKNCIKDKDCTTGFCHQGKCKAPSCQDGIQNQNEEGIDCGGVCNPCEKEPVNEQPEDYTLTDEQEDKLDEKLTQGTKSTFLISSHPSGLNVGESLVYAYGITNMNVNDDTTRFRYNIEFKRARDTMNSPINVDEQTVLAWFDEKEFPEPTLETYEQDIIPVGFTVGETISPGQETKKGSYYFEIVVEEKDGRSWDEYTTDEFSFRVK